MNEPQGYPHQCVPQNDFFGIFTPPLDIWCDWVCGGHKKIQRYGQYMQNSFFGHKILQEHAITCYNHQLDTGNNFTGRGISADIHCSLQINKPQNREPTSKIWILLGNKYHYKRDMFCKIKISTYFVAFINDNNVTMIFNIG